MRNKVFFLRDFDRHIFWGKVPPGWIPTEGKEFSLKIFSCKYIWIRSKARFIFLLLLLFCFSFFKKGKLSFGKNPKGYGGFCMTCTFSWRCLPFQVRSLDQVEDERMMQTWPHWVVRFVLCKKSEQMIAVVPPGLQICIFPVIFLSVP